MDFKEHQNLRAVRAVVAGSTLLFGFWLVRQFAHAELWFDEIVSLTHYALKGLEEAATNYSAPNNHVFFNVVNALYVKAAGIATAWVDPWRLRAVPFAFTVVSLVFIYLAGARINRRVGALALAILASTPPFLSFTMQLRGYSPSMALLAVLAWGLFSLEKTKDGTYAIPIGLAAGLAVYTLPVNVLVVGFVGLWQLAALAGDYRTKAPAEVKQRRLGVLAALTFGVILAAVLYWPMRDQLATIYLHGDFEKKNSQGFFVSHVHVLFLESMRDFLSGRLFLLVPAVALFWSAFKERSLARESFSVSKSLFCAALIVFFYFVQFAFGLTPPDRVFSSLLPFFALFLAGAADGALKRFIPVYAERPTAGLVAVALYCHLCFAVALLGAESRHVEAIKRGSNLPYDMAYHKLYDLDSRTREAVFRRIAADPKGSLVCWDLFWANYWVYAERFGVKEFYQEFNDPLLADLLRKNGKTWIITPRPLEFLAEFGKKRPDLRFTLESGEFGVANIFRVEPR